MRGRPPTPVTRAEIKEENAVLSEVERTESRTPTTFKRTFIALVAVLVVGAASYAAASSYRSVGANQKAIIANCESGNATLRAVNDKFKQFNKLIALNSAENPPGPDDPQPSAEVLALYAEFQKPIPLVNCQP
jgi:cytochrome c-type biogenesis protein CcmH/NrfG